MTRPTSPAAYPDADNLQIDLSGRGRIDYSCAVILGDLVEDTRKAGYDVDVVAVPVHAQRILRAVWPKEME